MNLAERRGDCFCVFLLFFFCFSSGLQAGVRSEILAAEDEQRSVREENVKSVSCE
jgi:hypothetical protein